MARDLNELHVRKLEKPGRARVKVTHVINGLSVIAEGFDRHEAKLKAYAELAAKMGKHGAAAAYTDAAKQALRNYQEKLKREADGDF